VRKITRLNDKAKKIIDYHNSQEEKVIFNVSKIRVKWASMFLISILNLTRKI